MSLPGLSKFKYFALFVWLGIILIPPRVVSAQAADPPPAELVRKAVQNEIKGDTDPDSSYMFQSRKETPRGSQTKMMVETRDAMAGMLIAVNDQPLTAAQRQAEQDRLNYIAGHADELRRKQKQEKDDADRITRILRAMPDAFLYENNGTEPAKPGVGNPGHDLVRLKFRPNPKYEPPTRVEQVLTGMEGQILIDTARNRIAKIDGTLFRDVGFGWGILGHLDRGGRFQVDQGTIDGGNGWAMTRISLDFTGKVLLFKSIVIKSTETFSNFRPVAPNLTFAEGASLLAKEATSKRDGAAQ
jgi:hypothetical protein